MLQGEMIRRSPSSLPQEELGVKSVERGKKEREKMIQRVEISVSSYPEIARNTPRICRLSPDKKKKKKGESLISLAIHIETMWRRNIYAAPRGELNKCARENIRSAGRGYFEKKAHPCVSELPGYVSRRRRFSTLDMYYVTARYKTHIFEMSIFQSTTYICLSISNEYDTCT